MKFKRNEKYETISAYVILTFCVCLLILIMLFKFSILQAFAHKLLKVTAPVIWGIVIAYLLSPIQRVIEKCISKLTNRKKERRTLTRVLSITFTILLFILAFVALIANIVPELIDSITNIFGNMQSYFDSLQDFVEKQFVKFKNANPEIKNFIYSEMDNIESVMLSMAESLKPKLESFFSKDGFLANLTGSAVSLIVGVKDFMIGLIVSVYLLFNKENFTANIKKLICAVFDKKKSMKILHISSEANKVFLSFLSGKALDSLIIGILCSISMTILDMPYVVLISVIVGVTNMIPFFGPIIGAIPSGFLILLSNPSKTIAFLIMILVIQQLDGSIIGPKILGNQLGVNAFLILFSLIIGGGFFGFIGMILAVPFIAVIRPLLTEFIDNRLSNKNLSTDINDYLEDRIEPPSKPVPIPQSADKEEVQISEKSEEKSGDPKKK